MILPPRNVLVSLHYHGSYDLDSLAGCRVVGDSGAFSAANSGATITVAQLAQWAQRWQHRLAWVAGLDVIGEVGATRRNWHELVDEWGVPGVPTIHYGCNPAEMGYYAARGVDFVGLGGMVGKTVEQQLRWAVACFRHARDYHPAMRFHGWGVTHHKLLRLPWYSVDSTSWSEPYRYGRLVLRDPRTGVAHGVMLDGRGTYDPTVVEVLRMYGVTPSAVARADKQNRRLLIKLSALSAAVAEQRFRRLHRHNPITAPTYGMAGQPAGPHMHLAIGADSGEREYLAHPDTYAVEVGCA